METLGTESQTCRPPVMNRAYDQDLKRETFSSDLDYLEARVRRGLAAGYTFEECQENWYEDFAATLPNEIPSFCWKMINPTEEDVLDVYVAILSCHIQSSGAYDYEYFYFTHEEMDRLFGWNRPVHWM